jgi:hypothetical protein
VGAGSNAGPHFFSGKPLRWLLSKELAAVAASVLYAELSSAAVRVEELRREASRLRFVWASDLPNDAACAQLGQAQLTPS